MSFRKQAPTATKYQRLPWIHCFDDPPKVELPLSSAEKNRLTEVKTKFVTLANSADLLGIAVAIVAEDFNKLIAEDPKNAERIGGDPYSLAYKALLMDAGLMMGYVNKKWGSAHVLAPIFDENEEVSGRAKQMYDEFRKENPQVSKWLVGMSYERDTRFLVLQAADNLAYEVNKWLFNAKYDAKRKERRAMTRLLERVYKIAQFDRRVLEEILLRGLTENTMYDALILQDFDIHAL